MNEDSMGEVIPMTCGGWSVRVIYGPQGWVWRVRDPDNLVRWVGLAKNWNDAITQATAKIRTLASVE